MNITLDGRVIEIPAGISLADLLESRHIDPPETCAVARNGVPLRREEWCACRLTEGDRIELATADGTASQNLPGFTTLAIHGPAPHREAEGALLPPVYFATAFEQESAESMERVFAHQEAGHVYSRLQNPTVQTLEERITACAGARGTVAVASGMSAMTLGLMALLQAGDELIAGRYLFGGSYGLFSRTLPALGITTHFIDPRQPEEAEALINGRTRAIFLEAIANPAVVVPDFAAFRAICDRHDLLLLADATLATPYLFDGKALGVDVAFYSASKYISGPAMTIGGLIVDSGLRAWHTGTKPDLSAFKKQGPHAFLAKLRNQLMADVGPALSPMTAFFHLLGLETLPLRLERQCANAERVAAFLQAHPRVQGVLYPGLPDSEFHRLSAAQFKGRFGSLMALTLADKAHCFRFLNALRVIRRATNLGDTKTLALHPASTIYLNFWPAERELAGVPENLIRLSVGIEDEADLLADLEQALRA